MTTKPFLTTALCFTVCVLYLLPEPRRTFLFFDLAQFDRGNFLGLVFGHWLHADMNHLIWNVSALAILGGLLERESRSLFVGSLIAGTVFVNFLLLSPLSTIERYCGLSGILNTVLASLLYLQWLKTRSMIVPCVACLAVAKAIVESTLQQGIFTDISWPTYAPAHLAGMLAAAGLIVMFDHHNKKTAGITRRGG